MVPKLSPKLSFNNSKLGGREILSDNWIALDDDNSLLVRKLEVSNPVSNENPDPVL